MAVFKSSLSKRQWRRLFVSLAVATLMSSCGEAAETSELQLMSSKPTSCVYERAYGMYGVHCGGLKLTAVPKNLKTSIEILDASDNKIRELTDDTFQSYTNVKYLYLEDNSIYTVEENALSPLTYMETLDLSQNAITTVPNTILYLPSLRKLLLSGNPLIHWQSDLVHLNRPIKAPLEQIDISNCKLKLIPDLGILPELKTFNVSDNSLDRLLPNTFAQTCRLLNVDLSRSLNKIRLCSLKPAVDWLSQHGVYFALEDYERLNTNEFHNCPELPADDDMVNSTYNECMSAVASGPVYRTSRQTWLTITGGLFGFVVGFMLLLYIMHRRNVAQTNITKKKNTHLDAKQVKDKIAAEALLNPE